MLFYVVACYNREVAQIIKFELTGCLPGTPPHCLMTISHPFSRRGLNHLPKGKEGFLGGGGRSTVKLTDPSLVPACNCCTEPWAAAQPALVKNADDPYPCASSRPSCACACAGALVLSTLPCGGSCSWSWAAGALHCMGVRPPHASLIPHTAFASNRGHGQLLSRCLTRRRGV